VRGTDGEDYGRMVVLTWNLFHGRSLPDTPRELLDAFAQRLAGWDWDVALLQEVPPWWPPALGRACRASARTALTSRNQLAVLRRFAARRRPDLTKSGGGGANAILVRGQTIVAHRSQLLRRWPERRVAHGVRTSGGWWISNVHAQAHVERWARADVRRTLLATMAWAGDAPTVLGGDLNLRAPVVPGFSAVAGRDVDHLFVRGAVACGPARLLERDGLSDHAPLAVELTAAGRIGPE
jgi:endonuclease/exonuclease/phosphatase family metal-dependent hydrolase